VLVGIEVEHYSDDVLAFPEMDLLVRMNNLDLNWREFLLSSPRCFTHNFHPNTPSLATQDMQDLVRYQPIAVCIG
jgi:hypothetical protein